MYVKSEKILVRLLAPEKMARLKQMIPYFTAVVNEYIFVREILVRKKLIYDDPYIWDIFFEKLKQESASSTPVQQLTPAESTKLINNLKSYFSGFGFGNLSILRDTFIKDILYKANIQKNSSASSLKHAVDTTQTASTPSPPPPTPPTSTPPPPPTPPSTPPPTPPPTPQPPPPPTPSPTPSPPLHPPTSPSTSSTSQSTTTTSPSTSSTSQSTTTSPSSADAMLYNNKNWNTDYMPFPVKKEDTGSNPVRDAIVFFIFLNWILGAIVFVTSFNFTNISSNDIKKSVITFLLGFWGYLMYVT